MAGGKAGSEVMGVGEPVPAAMLGREGPAPRLGSTVEMALSVGVVGEPVLRVRVWKSLFCLFSIGRWHL